MNKLIISFLLFITVCVSCKTSENEKNKTFNKLEIGTQYYKALDQSDSTKMTSLVGDSIVIRENKDNYEERFSRQGYKTWLAWESVFDPTYNILQIREEKDIVIAKVSKTDKRIFFLTQEPVVWVETLQFDQNRIVKVNRMEYEVFNIDKFVKNRDSLVQWIDKNHKELSGFLYPQTKSTGIKYLKAIELYNKEKGSL
ncbi:hypothetical protein [Aquimarina sp. 433]